MAHFYLLYVLCLLTFSFAYGRYTDEKFAKTHREISEWLRRYISAEKQRLGTIRKRLEVFEAAVKAAEGVDPEEYLGLPMNAFLLIKRLAKDFKEIVEIAKDETNSKLLLEMRPDGKRGRKLRFPTRKDVLEASRNVLNYQKENGLTAAQVADGIGANETDLQTQLSARDCYEISIAAKRVGEIEQAREWMQVAESRTGDATMDSVVVNEYLAIFAFELGDTENAMAFTQKVVAMDPRNVRGILNLEFYEQVATKPYGVGYKRPENREFQDFVQDTISFKPYCRRISYRHNVRFPGNVYVETIRKEPPVLLYRNFLSESEALFLQEAFQFGSIELGNGGENISPGSKSAAMLQELSGRIEGVTGLALNDEQAPWRIIRTDCQYGTLLSPGQYLKRKPLATWWTFLSESQFLVDQDNGTQLFMGQSILRYHVGMNGHRESEMIQYNCSGNSVILAKRIMLEDQQQFYSRPIKAGSFVDDAVDSLLKMPSAAWNMTIGLVM